MYAYRKRLWLNNGQPVKILMQRSEKKMTNRENLDSSNFYTSASRGSELLSVPEDIHKSLV